MDPVTLIADALAAAVLKGTGEAASTAVKDAYTALKNALATRFAEHQVATTVLDDHEEDPETYEKPLLKKIQQAGAGDDPRILELAQTLLRLMDESGSRAGKYAVNIHESQGVQIGDHSTQHNTFS
jgi:hypothetical protein